MVSTIWGHRAADLRRPTARRWCAAPSSRSAFMDIWKRAASGRGDIGAGRDVPVGPDRSRMGRRQPLAVPLAAARRRTATAGCRSSSTSTATTWTSRQPEFTLGRIAGTIGPAAPDEPHHFVRGSPVHGARGTPGLLQPAGKLNFCVAAVDEAAGKVHLDLGNALPTDDARRPASRPRDALARAPADRRRSSLGESRTGDAGWYERTAGVVDAARRPRADRRGAEADLRRPLALVAREPGRHAAHAVAEPPGGLHVRADQFVFRLEPGRQRDVRGVRDATSGAPLRGSHDLRRPSTRRQLQFGSPTPPVATRRRHPLPAPTVVAGATASRRCRSSGNDPGNPRGYIDGQVYGDPARR